MSAVAAIYGIVSEDASGTPAPVLPESNAGNGAHLAHNFAVLPAGAAPRWLLPVDYPRCGRAAILAYQPFAPQARLARAALLACMRTRLSPSLWARDRVHIPEGTPLEELLLSVTGERRLVLAFTLGTPTRVRKLMAQVMRPDGEILGYAKLPMTRAAVARLRNEAGQLERLADVPQLRSHVPRVLHAADWGQGSFVLLQSAGPSQAGPVRLERCHREFLNTLWGVTPSSVSGAALVQEVSEFWSKATEDLPEMRSDGAAALERAARQLAGMDVRCGLMHGDFAPWNTRGGRDGLFVFDWESAEQNRPIAWDVFHFHVQTHFFLKSRAPLPVIDCAGSGLFILYLLYSAASLLEEAGDCPDVRFRLHLLREQIS